MSLPKTKLVQAQQSWKLMSSSVECYLTQAGGHLGPIVFDRAGLKLAPYSIAPWAKEKIDSKFPPLLKALRGDFFCLPFGGNGTKFNGESHPPHGETANAKWKFEGLAKENGTSTLHVSLATKVRKGRVDKRVSVRDGHNAVYVQHAVAGMSGPMDFGHHAMIKFPDEPGSGLISTSPFEYAQVLPEPFERPECCGYSMLKPGATFTKLAEVPTITGEMTDLSRYPARRGFEDLVMLVADRSLSIGWTAVTFPAQRYVWFSLKDPRVLRNTVFWISNGGRHYAPWNGRHVSVMGLEDVTSYFHFGLAESARPNSISEKGYATTTQLDPAKPLVVNYIMAAIPVPAGFDRVVSITPNQDGVVLVSASGKSVSARVDTAFLQSGE
ncbi:MAG TPA: hypothetical protein VGP72_29690 [Planctomycetota bacterium]|jgi:hypothetical protein